MSELVRLRTYSFGTQVTDEGQHRQAENVVIGELLVHKGIQAFLDIRLDNLQRVCVHFV
jgi:hypothetical protein